MKKAFRTTAFLAFTILFSCEEQGWIVKCADCYSEEPFETSLIIYIENTYPYLTHSVVLNIYEGNLEDNILANSYSTALPKWEESVKINKKYTVTATYEDNHGLTYTAVDSATPGVRHVTDQCDDPCYLVYDNKIELRLKYKRKFSN